MPVIDSPVFENRSFGEVPIIDAVATIDDEKEGLTVFAVNRDQEDSVSFECDMRSLEGYKVIEHIVLEHQDIKARNTKDNPHTIVPHKNGDASIEAGIITAILPKLSWNVIRLLKR